MPKRMSLDKQIALLKRKKAKLLAQPSKSAKLKEKMRLKKEIANIKAGKFKKASGFKKLIGGSTRFLEKLTRPKPKDIAKTQVKRAIQKQRQIVQQVPVQARASGSPMETAFADTNGQNSVETLNEQIARTSTFGSPTPKIARPKKQKPFDINKVIEGLPK